MQALRMQIRCVFIKTLPVAFALNSMPVRESFKWPITQELSLSSPPAPPLDPLSSHTGSSTDTVSVLMQDHGSNHPVPSQDMGGAAVATGQGLKLLTAVVYNVRTQL